MADREAGELQGPKEATKLHGNWHLCEYWFVLEKGVDHKKETMKETEWRGKPRMHLPVLMPWVCRMVSQTMVSVHKPATRVQ